MGLKTKLRAGSKLKIIDENGEVLFEATIKRPMKVELSGWVIRENDNYGVDWSRLKVHNPDGGA